MDWQHCFYNGNLQKYVEECRKLILDLKTVNINVPNEILTFSLLVKLGGDPKLYQLVEGLTLNKDVIQRPNTILSRLQDYVKLTKIKEPSRDFSASALVTATNELYKIIYYCTNGVHNPKCTTHKKEECFSENPHLRTIRKEKRKHGNAYSNVGPHLSTAQALVRQVDSNIQSHQLVVDCGATHHMFNSKAFFLSMSETMDITVSTGDSNSTLKAFGFGTVQLLCDNKTLTLKNCLHFPHLNCNLISLMDLFKDWLIVNQKGSFFNLEARAKTLLKGHISNKVMYVDYSLPRGLLSIDSTTLWHNRLGLPGPTPAKLLGLPSGIIDCMTCNLNKADCFPFNNHFEHANLPLDCIHINLVGPISPPSVSGFRYFLTVIDQFTSSKVF
ncbi:hypothetical protein O181_050475 [Austropuccinia psidii MF-1]|uniref:Retrovirus-related Pol polyprotein from transposon TNT 1-94-like beta-barrel domain-containing protein n=1 Tax=Austropuccinia psidii MF-1 TaxID=1389203 RepID=A0A9Q3HQY5_9BASI|nr:hypothetical protein [Austropuccinia psidii MF-1]